jgi:hypothetical protein
MRIHVPEISRERDAVKVAALVERSGGTQRLWYSVPHCYEEYLRRDRLDPFVLGLLLLGMKDGEDIHVDGVMSEKLCYNLTNYYIRMLRILMPALHRIEVVPEQLEGATSGRGRGVGLGFSAGVDSFSALADHFLDPVPVGYRVTHLFFNNVGSHGVGGRRLFEDRYARILPVARELGIPVITVDSNLDEMLAGFDYESEHGLRNMSAVLLLQGLLRRYLYASTHRYEECNVRGAGWMSSLDPAALHLLSTEMTECVSTGSQYSRVEKTARISDIPITHRYLDVCVSERAGNCSRCWKCCRTMLTLEMLGKLDRYSGVFDLEVWQKNRVRFMGRVLTKWKPLAREIVESAPSYNWRFPAVSRLYAGRYTLAQMVHRMAGRLRAGVSRSRRRGAGAQD